MCVAGEIFPECRECGRNAKFTLQRDIPHVLECALFESSPKAPTRIAERPRRMIFDDVRSDNAQLNFEHLGDSFFLSAI